jgi:MerR family transcriptional regulator/heat shock protein HspR
MQRKKGYYSISAVSKMTNLHQQTIRLYEREGLISPKRSDGNTRMFSEEDIVLLEQIIHFTSRVGVNLAGVEIILKMQKKIDKLQSEINNMFSSSRIELEAEKTRMIVDTEHVKEELKKIKKKNSNIEKKFDILKEKAFVKKNKSS